MTAQPNPVVAEDVERILTSPLEWNELAGSTILISGASGFLPAYMVETLASLNAKGAGMRVIGIVRNRQRAEARFAHLDPAIAGLELIEHDIARPLPKDLPAAQYIVHAASQASPRFYGSDPVGTLEANTFGTAWLLEHAARSQSRSFLYFSSGEVYGKPEVGSRRLSETDFGWLDPATVRACYAESKRMGETLCVSWAHQHGVPARMVRPFHTYGPGMSLTDGRVFADFVADVVARRDISLLSDGLAMRPFCYLADATVAFFTVLLRGATATAYNVGNPDAEISIRDLAQMLADLYPELNLEVRQAQAAPATGYLQTTVSRSTPDIARIGSLGWSPTTTLQTGFRRTLRSFDCRLA